MSEAASAVTLPRRRRNFPKDVCSIAFTAGTSETGDSAREPARGIYDDTDICFAKRVALTTQPCMASEDAIGSKCTMTCQCRDYRQPDGLVSETFAWSVPIATV